MTTLYELARKIRNLPGLTEEVAREAVPEMRQVFNEQVDAQQDCNGKPWPKARSERTHLPMLEGAKGALSVVVARSSIILSLPFEPWGRHSTGAVKGSDNGGGQKGKKASKLSSKSVKKQFGGHNEGKGSLKRELLPGNPNFLPPNYRAVLVRLIERMFAKRMAA
jgi:hypothetical protein